MTKLKSIFMVLILLASIGVASASPFEDVVNWIKENANPLSWYLKSPSYSDGVVTFTVTYTGGWSAVIKDPSYNIVASTSGSGYGIKSMELKPTVTGTYLFILNCPRADCGKEDPFNVGQVYGTPTATPTPTVTATPPIDKPKPVIIPPSVSRLWESLISWLSSWFPSLSISGGSNVNVMINAPYTTTMSLAFAPPDTVYNDGSYTAKFGEWVILDSNKNLKYESGWSSELVTSPYTVTASYTPIATGKYFLIGLISKQTYTWDGTKWTMVEVVETKEVQELNVGLPGVQVTKPIGISAFLTDITSWLKGLFSWLSW